jgi:hypothetical protein
VKSVLPFTRRISLTFMCFAPRLLGGVPI